MGFFNVITLFGGLAMFLYGMRIMGDGLKESASGTLKKAMEKVTNSPLKAFILGVAITAIIQSSTATIVITSGLVAAEIITLRQSLGIIVGANVGTTVTGQIIRLLDLNESAAAWLQLFKPSTLAPVALIIGIIMIMFLNFKNSDKIGSIAMGFGILFSGLLNMTGSVDALSAKGAFDGIFSSLGDSPLIGYLSGASVAFVLQSSSATIGILQAFSASGQLQFKAIYSVITGIYLGDCVTTAIVCSIGAKPEAKKVGIVNILFNLSETVIVLVVVNIVHSLGFIDRLWNAPVNSGIIANTNTIFNFGCAMLLLPVVSVYEKLSCRIVKSEPAAFGKYDSKLESLNPVFFNTPALALNSCYEVMLSMFSAARMNIDRALGLLSDFDEKLFDTINEEENCIDRMTDRISNYLLDLSPHITLENHTLILDQYYKDVTEFERLGDHATNIAEIAKRSFESGETFTEDAVAELDTICRLIEEILNYAELAFQKRDVDAARHIEPLEQVVDDMVSALNDNHFQRLREGKCSLGAGTSFMNLLSELERISDVCSNIGVATLARAYPELAIQAHEYVSVLHQNEDFNLEYSSAHDEYFNSLQKSLLRHSNQHE